MGKAGLIIHHLIGMTGFHGKVIIITSTANLQGTAISLSVTMQAASYDTATLRLNVN